MAAARRGQKVAAFLQMGRGGADVAPHVALRHRCQRACRGERVLKTRLRQRCTRENVYARPPQVSSHSGQATVTASDVPAVVSQYDAGAATASSQLSPVGS